MREKDGEWVDAPRGRLKVLLKDAVHYPQTELAREFVELLKKSEAKRVDLTPPKFIKAPSKGGVIE